MLKLMKYELRKSWLSKLILLSVLGVSELMFLFGIFLTDPQSSPYTAIGIGLLVGCTIAGLSFIGIESILTLHKDLNTKQSYMLFMTPRNGYQILGAKILENALTIAAVSVMFLALAVADIGILISKIGGLKEAMQFVQSFFELDITLAEFGRYAMFVFGNVVVSWFVMIVTGYLAVILVASVLAGRKFSGLAALVLFIILTTVRERILNLISGAAGSGYMDTNGFLLFIAINIVFAGLLYMASCLMMEKKLSV